MALCSLFLLVISVWGMPGWLTVAQNDGTWGMFTAVREDCTPRAGCSWYGEFRSDDGAIHIDDAGGYSGDGIQRPGDSVRAQVVPGDKSVYSDHDNVWLYVGAADLACLAYLVYWIKVRRWRGPRSEQRAANRDA